MSKPKKLCKKPSCRALISFDETYCEKHRGTYNRSYNQVRKQSEAEYVRFYKLKPWLEIREVALIRDNYLCVACLRKGIITPAQLVDHIVPIKQNWSLRLTLDNLQSLCESCHQVKTKQDNG